jgi:hypothetical protein
MNCCVHCYILCAWWGLDVASSLSCCPSGSPMDVLPLPLLQADCLSYSPLGGPGPPSTPHSWWPHFPQGTRTPSCPCPLKKMYILTDRMGLLTPDLFPSATFTLPFSGGAGLLTLLCRLFNSNNIFTFVSPATIWMRLQYCSTQIDTAVLQYSSVVLSTVLMYCSASVLHPSVGQGAQF